MLRGSFVWILLTSAALTAPARGQVRNVIVVLERADTDSGRELERDFTEALRARFGGEVEIVRVGADTEPSVLLARSRAVVALDEAARLEWWTESGREEAALSSSLGGFDLAREAAALAHLALRERFSPTLGERERDRSDEAAHEVGEAEVSPTEGERMRMDRAPRFGPPRPRAQAGVDLGVRLGREPVPGARVVVRLVLGPGSIGFAAEVLAVGARDEGTNRRRLRAPMDVHGRVEVWALGRGSLQLEASLGLTVVRDDRARVVPTFGVAVAPSLRVAEGLALELPLGIHIALATAFGIPRVEGRAALGLRFD
ncbi:MAG: hypothetical protein KF901_22795 [Myxococcales bacterium]|nr:hypothetical protein [Myxococcales bacterium]